MPDLYPLWLTFKLAAVTTVILFLIGIPLAYWTASSRNKFRYIVESIVSLPLVLPPTVLGFYLLVALSPKYFLGHFFEQLFDTRLVFSFPGLVIGSVIFSLPFMVNPIKSAFQSFPSDLIEASYSFGKSSWETLRRVILPNVMPSVLTGIIMSFAHTIGEFGVVLMIGGNIPEETRVASIAIYGEVESMNYQAANFYSLILVTVSFVILLSLYVLNRKSFYDKSIF